MLATVTAHAPTGSRADGFDYNDAITAAELLREIYACHAEAADQIADASRIGHLSTRELEQLAGRFGLTELIGYGGDITEVAWM